MPKLSRALCRKYKGFPDLNPIMCKSDCRYGSLIVIWRSLSTDSGEKPTMHGCIAKKFTAVSTAVLFMKCSRGVRALLVSPTLGVCTSEPTTTRLREPTTTIVKLPSRLTLLLCTQYTVLTAIVGGMPSFSRTSDDGRPGVCEAHQPRRKGVTQPFPPSFRATTRVAPALRGNGPSQFPI